MNSNLILILVASQICYFINDILIKYSSLQTGSIQLIKNRTIYTILFCSIWLFISGDIDHSPNALTSVQIISLSIICSLGLYFFIKANKWANFPVVIAIHLVGLILQQVFSYIFLKENVASDLWIALPGILAGIIILISSAEINKGIYYAIISTGFWSLGYVLLTIPLKHTTTIWTSTIMEITIGIFFWGISFLKKDYMLPSTSIQSQLIFILMGISTLAASLLIFHAYRHYTVSDISYLYILYYPLSLCVNKFYFKQKFNLRETIGTITIISSILYYYVFQTSQQ